MGGGREGGKGGGREGGGCHTCIKPGMRAVIILVDYMRSVAGIGREDNRLISQLSK